MAELILAFVILHEKRLPLAALSSPLPPSVSGSAADCSFSLLPKFLLCSYVLGYPAALSGLGGSVRRQLVLRLLACD